MYKEICESEDFLSHMDANQYSNFISPDYLCSPSETFVFTSVMQWIKYKKEQWMTPSRLKLSERFVWGWWTSG